jgi:hypothetical protein
MENRSGKKTNLIATPFMTGQDLSHRVHKNVEEKDPHRQPIQSWLHQSSPVSRLSSFHRLDRRGRGRDKSPGQRGTVRLADRDHIPPRAFLASVFPDPIAIWSLDVRMHAWLAWIRFAQAEWFSQVVFENLPDL